MRYQSLFFSLALGTLLLGCPQDQTVPAESEQPSSQEKTVSTVPSPVPVEEPSPPEALANTLRWQTASEVDVFGFEVFRAELEEGPYETLQQDPMAGHGTTDEPHAYVFVDDTIEPGRGYWYWVEEITLNGARSKITPNPWYAKPKGDPLPVSSEVESGAPETEQ